MLEGVRGTNKSYLLASNLGNNAGGVLALVLSMAQLIGRGLTTAVAVGEGASTWVSKRGAEGERTLDTHLLWQRDGL